MNRQVDDAEKALPCSEVGFLTTNFFGYRRLHKGIDGNAIISGDWKLLRETKKDGQLRLFNIAKDPFEEHDLATELPDQAKRLRKQLEELEDSCQKSRDGADYHY